MFWVFKRHQMRFLSSSEKVEPIYAYKVSPVRKIDSSALFLRCNKSVLQAQLASRVMITNQKLFVRRHEYLFSLNFSQGLNFSIHADAAWGAYFACMLREPPIGDPMPTPSEEGFVPELFLNEHVTKQLKVVCCLVGYLFVVWKVFEIGF